MIFILTVSVMVLYLYIASTKIPKMVKFTTLNLVKNPTRGTKGSAGIDFYSPEDFTIPPFGKILVQSGIKVKIPKGYCMIGLNKSGVAVKKQVYIGACLIDEDYQGEIGINLYNPNPTEAIISKDEKIVQFILAPFIKSKWISVFDEKDLFTNKTQRGNGGFGSTGIF